MPLFPVRVTLDIVVAADDKEHAEDLVDRRLIRDAVTDSPEDFEKKVGEEITTVEQLKMLNSDWDEECMPYGDTDGNTKIKEYLNGPDISKPS